MRCWSLIISPYLMTAWLSSIIRIINFKPLVCSLKRHFLTKKQLQQQWRQTSNIHNIQNIHFIHKIHNIVTIYTKRTGTTKLYNNNNHVTIYNNNQTTHINNISNNKILDNQNKDITSTTIRCLQFLCSMATGIVSDLPSAWYTWLEVVARPWTDLFVLDLAARSESQMTVKL